MISSKMSWQEVNARRQWFCKSFSFFALLFFDYTYKSELVSIVYKVLKLFTTFFFKKIQNPAKFGGLARV